MENKKLSMTDIAELSGVSVATVSRILNKNGRYSAETEKRVLEVIKKYDYKINQSAKSLRTSHTNSIGVIVPDITNEFFSKIIRAIETYTLPTGYTVFVCDSNESEEIENIHISSLVEKNVDGIIYISVKSDVKKIHEDYDIPVVYIDRRPEHAGNLVISDNEAGGYLAGQALIDSGCKKMIMLRDRRMFSTVKTRYRGFVGVLAANGFEISDECFLDTDVDYAKAKADVEEYLLNHKIDGIFANNDMMALAALHGARNAGYFIPDDIKIVGFDGITLTQFSNPPITTIRQDAESYGKESVAMILKMINGEHVEDEVRVVPVELIKGGTTKFE